MKSIVWLLMGLTGSTEGVLSLENGRVSFEAFGQGALTDGQLVRLARAVGSEHLAQGLKRGIPAMIFDEAVGPLTKISFPWYTFGGGVNLAVRSGTYRFSFLQPQNTISGTRGKEMSTIATNLSEGRKLGKLWKTAFENIKRFSVT